MVVLVFVLVVPITIVAFYSDMEKIDNQNFTAAELRFASLPEEPDQQYFSPVLDQEYVFDLPTAFTASSTKALYDITSSIGGDADFCASLRITAEGYLGSISAGAPYFETEPLTSGASWQVKLGYDIVSTNFAHGAKCDVTLTVEGWQENMTKATAGYRDTYSMTVPIVAQMVVLNEVLAKPTPGEDEFIELYNHSDYPVDVAGFNITELTAGGNTTNHIIRSISLGSTDMVAYDGSGNTIVPAHGFLALRYSGNTSYLNDTGDTITLLDTDNINLDTYTFITAVTNKSDARIPDGIGAWVDPVPTPNEPNILTGEEITEIIPEALVADVLGEEIIVIEVEVASGTEPIITEGGEILPEEGENEAGNDVVDETDETVSVEEVLPALEPVIEEEVIEPETVEEEIAEEEESEQEEVVEEEEEVEEVIQEPII